MPFNVAIVTSCTQRKAVRASADLDGLPTTEGLRALADAWRGLLVSAPLVGTAATLYQGRSISDTASVATHLSSQWYVVSAGLGLVSAEQPVPSYDCTVATGSKLCDRLAHLRASDADWWSALTESQPHPLSRLISQGPTLLALPSSYLRMVLHDLSRVSRSEAEYLRIFTSTAGAAIVPDRLAACVMPYDDRLESVPGYSGTRTDFAQRALRHFVLKLNATRLPRDEARERVKVALLRRPRPSRTQGVRLSDDEICKALLAQWTRHEGRSTRLLRYLRDEAGISCEQRRFSRIWQSIVSGMKVRS